MKISTIIQIVWLILSIGALVFMVLGVYHWGKTDGVKQELKPCEIAIIQGNSLLPVIPPFIPQTMVYGAIMSPENDLMWEVMSKYPELYDIIVCESGWKTEVCNNEYGCKAGMGLAQFIPSTWEYIKSKGIKVADPFDLEDNLTAALWLYTTEGNNHWEQSRHCWDK